MKAFIDPEICIGCELCTGVCPGVFSMKDDGFSHPIVDIVPVDAEESVKDAEEWCPMGAIRCEEPK